MKSGYVNKIKETDSYKEGDIHQAILDVSYEEWQKNKDWDYLDMVNWALENGGEVCAAAILTGKYNQQIGNGGHYQYYDNNYASGKGGAFSKHDSTDLEAHDQMMNFMTDLQWDQTEAGAQAFSIMKDFEEALVDSDQLSTCEECGGAGEIDCPECEGEGQGEVDEEGNDIEVECDECNGRGIIECPECYGRGEVEVEKGQVGQGTIEVFEHLDTMYYKIDDVWMKEINEFCKLDMEEISVDNETENFEAEPEPEQPTPPKKPRPISATASGNEGVNIQYEALNRLEKELDNLLQEAKGSKEDDKWGDGHIDNQIENLWDKYSEQNLSDEEIEKKICHKLGLSSKRVKSVLESTKLEKLDKLLQEAEYDDEYEPEDCTDEICPCNDPDCMRPFGHAEEDDWNEEEFIESSQKKASKRYDKIQEDGPQSEEGNRKDPEAKTTWIKKRSEIDNGKKETLDVQFSLDAETALKYLKIRDGGMKDIYDRMADVEVIAEKYVNKLLKGSGVTLDTLDFLEADSNNISHAVLYFGVGLEGSRKNLQKVAGEDKELFFDWDEGEQGA